MKPIAKYSLGMGDRFGHQGQAQLRAIIEAQRQGIVLTPVWNKSNREHGIVGSQPSSLRREADEAVAALGWPEEYHVDADHIHLGTVDGFIETSDFFTIDVADYTGKATLDADINVFVQSLRPYFGRLTVSGIACPLMLEETTVRAATMKFLWAIQEAGRVYRHIAERKGDNFITEVSVDETDAPQTPVELFCILAMLAREGVAVQTIAPKFTGRFNKGVDYVGDLAVFEREFDENLAVVHYAIHELGLPATLKLSVHSGSDKFSIYPIINRLLKKHGAGVHVKTAGTTWLEELIGLAESGGEGLQIARAIYISAYRRFEELVKPYAPVVNIDPARLPLPDEVATWDSDRYIAALRHEPACREYNLHFRQFLHVSFKIAAEMGSRYTDALKANQQVISRNVTENILDRHIKPIFG